MRVAIANVVRPRERIGPEELLRAWPTLANVAGAVRRAGADVTVLQSFHLAAELDVDDVHYRFVAEPALPGRARGFMPWRLARAARAAGAEVIQVNGLDFAWHTRVLCGLGLPVLARDHSSSPGVRRNRRRWGLEKVAGVAFTSAVQAEPFLRNGTLGPNVRVFEVPESSTAFTPGPLDAARAAAGIHGDPAVLWVGRLDSNKDPLTIIEAVERAATALPGLQLWCCFHEQPLLRAVAARLERSPDLAQRVHLLGKVPHPRIEMLCRAADFFMLGSHRESTGYALIEAMACGATPIVSDIPAFRSLTGDGAVGALVRPGDAQAFSDALVALAPRRAEDLRGRARKHFERTLSFDRLGSRLCEIYVELLRAAA